MFPKISIPVSGRFCSIQAIDKRGRVVREVGGFDNLVTNAGLSRLNVAGGTFQYCRVGVGNSEPLPTDLSLDAQIASKGGDIPSSNGLTMVRGTNLAEGYCWARLTWTFDLGAVVGNVSEVGTGWAATGNTLFSRALVRDAMGNPTSITILEDEQLRVTWEHRRYFPLSDMSGVIVNSGNKGGSYEWTIRTARASSWTASGQGIAGGGGGWYGSPNPPTSGSNPPHARRGDGELGVITGSPGGDFIPGNLYSFESSNKQYGRRYRFIFDTSQGNFEEGVGVFLIGNNAVSSGNQQSAQIYFQVKIGPVHKTEDDFLEIDIDIDWTRA